MKLKLKLNWKLRTIGTDCFSPNVVRKDNSKIEIEVEAEKEKKEKSEERKD